ncbi:iron-sulfur cluster assembly protein [Amycolatopsis circi]|uniref:iron-sulfur cluster assembly protein n=1 Tax=Amycolatopsis circi TaxID=871959 RepID=UPI000E22DD2A|nr:iron-sulfur cluster assembly protein [Amycolatopsis circi]
MTTIAVLETLESQTRVTAADARAALARVRGLSVVDAVAKLRLGPGRTCEPVARVLDKALANAGRAGLSPGQLIVAGGSAAPAEPIVRVRRKAHGKADWISSETADVRVELQPAGAYEAAAVPVPVGAADEPVVDRVPEDARSVPVREALYDVLDPDLGVNIVDLGFVRGVTVDEHDVATLTMTLTSPACPLTGIMEDQIRTALLDGGVVADFRVVWVWSPPWRPSDISDDGREQLHAIGFSNF